MLFNNFIINTKPIKKLVNSTATAFSGHASPVFLIGRHIFAVNKKNWKQRPANRFIFNNDLLEWANIKRKPSVSLQLIKNKLTAEKVFQINLKRFSLISIFNGSQKGFKLLMAL